jgi:hypothetical protein
MAIAMMTPCWNTQRHSRSGWFILGGGEEGRVVVSVQPAGADYHGTGGYDTGDALVTQSVGGQETPLAGTFYVPLEMALQAHSIFYLHPRARSHVAVGRAKLEEA